MRLAAPSLLAAALLVAACDASPLFAIQSSQAERTDPVRILETDKERPPLAVDSPAGSVVLHGRDWSMYSVSAVRRGPTEADLDRIKVVFERGADGSVAVGWTAEGDRRGLSVSFTITTPQESAIAVKTGAGSVEAEGFTKGVRLHTGSGSVTAKGVQGDVAVDTGAGSIEVECGSGKVDAKTGAGSVKVMGRDGDLAVETGSGSIDILNAKGSVKARTGAGSVKVEGTLQGDCLAKSSAGSIELKIQEKASLVVEGRTDAGSIETDFDLKVEGKAPRRTVSGTLGDGKGGTLKVETGAGSIEIRKR